MRRIHKTLASGLEVEFQVSEKPVQRLGEYEDTGMDPYRSEEKGGIE